MARRCLCGDDGVAHVLSEGGGFGNVVYFKALACCARHQLGLELADVGELRDLSLPVGTGLLESRRAPAADGGSSGSEASNLETCNSGNAVGGITVRSTSRIASVATTRSTPKRSARRVASVDLPTPGAPLSAITKGRPERLTCAIADSDPRSPDSHARRS